MFNLFDVLYCGLLIALVVLLFKWLWDVSRQNPRHWRTGFGLFGLLVLLPILSETQYSVMNEGFVGAISAGDLVTVVRLLNLGANVNCEGDYEGTPLLFAVRSNHPAIVRLLIRRGADVNKAAYHSAYDHDVYQTPLQAAAGHPEIIAMLKKAGARE